MTHRLSAAGCIGDPCVAATVLAMDRPFSAISYEHYLYDPREIVALHDLADTSARALPTLEEPAEQPVVLSEYEDPLVPVLHRNIRTPAPYWHEGWDWARPGTWLRGRVAAALEQVAEHLADPWGLVVLDAWRPLDLQREIYESAYADPGLPAGFVAVPSADLTTPPAHVSGGAVDVTLSYEGVGLALGTAFDDFSELAHTRSYEDAREADELVRALRRMLYWTMAEEGFIVLDCEWWHFELGTRRWAALRGQDPWYQAAADPDGVLAPPWEGVLIGA